MKSKKLLCVVTIQTPDGLGRSAYHTCNAKAKFSVRYKESCRGNLVSQDLCGTHCNALVKNVKRLNTKLQYDSELVVVKL